MKTDSHCLTGKVLFVPIRLMEHFQDHRLVVRSNDPRSFPGCLNGDGLERIEYLQLTDLDADPSPLVKWQSVFPVDLVMTAPCREFSRLYAFAPLLDRGPVRVSIPVADGMEKAVRLAASLRFRVKIFPEQPEAGQVMSMIRLADFYLKNPTIEEHIEFFHSLFFAIVNSDITTLWEILEKDPARYCFVTDEGRIAHRAAPSPIYFKAMGKERGAEAKSNTGNAHDSLPNGVINRHKACVECTYFQWCRGFFKHPVSDYPCERVFPLFEHLYAAAEEFKQDLLASTSGAAS